MGLLEIREGRKRACFLALAVSRGLCGRRPLAPSHSLPVVGGINTMPGTWPWMVSIRTPFKSGYQHTCGGSLIGARWILTAAHCFRDIRVVQHENYQPRQQINDIALVELDDPVKCSDYIQPACLPDSSVDVSSMVHCYIAGWGYTREKGESLLALHMCTLGTGSTVLLPCDLQLQRQLRIVGGPWLGSISASDAEPSSEPSPDSRTGPCSSPTSSLSKSATSSAGHWWGTTQQDLHMESSDWQHSS
uniref:Peptidase S1 domain-containing protein n=1 Tax=Laticauda laticaudata TaxID=8630 RepID=A0A8C5SG93_LATLA